MNTVDLNATRHRRHGIPYSCGRTWSRSPCRTGISFVRPEQRKYSGHEHLPQPVGLGAQAWPVPFHGPAAQRRSASDTISWPKYRTQDRPDPDPPSQRRWPETRGLLENEPARYARSAAPRARRSTQPARSSEMLIDGQEAQGHRGHALRFGHEERAPTPAPPVRQQDNLQAAGKTSRPGRHATTRRRPGLFYLPDLLDPPAGQEARGFSTIGRCAGARRDRDRAKGIELVVIAGVLSPREAFPVYPVAETAMAN